MIIKGMKTAFNYTHTMSFEGFDWLDTLSQRMANSGRALISTFWGTLEYAPGQLVLTHFIQLDIKSHISEIKNKDIR